MEYQKYNVGVGKMAQCIKAFSTKPYNLENWLLEVVLWNVCVCMCVSPSRCQCQVSFLCHFAFWDRISQIIFVYIANYQAPVIFVSTLLYMTFICIDSEELNSGPYACRASTSFISSCRKSSSLSYWRKIFDFLKYLDIRYN